MITLFSSLKPLSSKIKLNTSKENVGMYFDINKNVNILNMIKNIDDQKGSELLNCILIYEKNHMKYRDTLFYNMQSVKIDKNVVKGTEGNYILDEEKNIIAYDDNIETIYHELIHMASSQYDKINSISYNGFGIYDWKNKIDIGEGLTEGYVELLCDKDIREGRSVPYLYDDESYEIPYEYVKQIARELEIILGKDKMERLFFVEGYYGLEKEILKLGKQKEEIRKFIKNCDVAGIASEHKSKILFNKTLEAQEFLYNICIEKYPHKIKEFEYEMMEISKNKKQLICDRNNNEMIIRLKNNDNIMSANKDTNIKKR